MAKLSSKQKQKMGTVESGGKKKFPIPDKSHAKNALARIDQAKPPLSAGQKATVRAKAEKMLGHKTASMKGGKKK